MSSRVPGGRRSVPGGMIVLGSDQSAGPQSHRELEPMVAGGIPTPRAIRISPSRCCQVWTDRRPRRAGSARQPLAFATPDSSRPGTFDELL